MVATNILDETAHDALDHSGLTGVGGDFPSGTAFPGSPSDRGLFYRTDRDRIYLYDLANTRWVTLEEFTLPLTSRAATNIGATTTLENMPVRQDYDSVITRIECPMFVSGGTALSASHKWEVSFNKINAANTATAISTITLDSGSLSTNIPKSATPAHLVDHTTYFTYSIIATKTGTPGNLFPSFAMFYRLVG